MKELLATLHLCISSFMSVELFIQLGKKKDQEKGVLDKKSLWDLKKKTQN